MENHDNFDSVAVESDWVLVVGVGEDITTISKIDKSKYSPNFLQSGHRRPVFVYLF